MNLVKTSVTALLAGGIVAGVGASASACEWQKQVMAKAATTPPTGEQAATTSATPVDPVLLAKNEKLEATTTEQE